jgi:hypothetical protein
LGIVSSEQGDDAIQLSVHAHDLDREDTQKLLVRWALASAQHSGIVALPFRLGKMAGLAAAVRNAVRS